MGIRAQVQFEYCIWFQFFNFSGSQPCFRNQKCPLSIHEVLTKKVKIINIFHLKMKFASIIRHFYCQELPSLDKVGKHWSTLYTDENNEAVVIYYHVYSQSMLQTLDFQYVIPVPPSRLPCLF